MKFKDGDVIKHINNKEVAYKVFTAIGSDRVKEVYNGLWITLRTNPVLGLTREFISINKRHLNNWKKYDHR